MGKSNRVARDKVNGSRNSKYEQKQESNGAVVPFRQGPVDWKLDWFFPSESQEAVAESIIHNPLTIADGPSGTGKTSTAVWKALQLYRAGAFKKIIFMKNPTEAGDDLIGYLKGEQEDKLKAHFQESQNIFLNFISKGKLESDISRGAIDFKIPNFILGATFDNAIIIIDEGQTMSENTMKLLLERAGTNSHIVVCGDSRQRYSVKGRNDGFADLIKKVTQETDEGRVSKEELMGYVKLTTDDNKRSELSKRITELYA